jgi:hypothetical protein
MDADVYPTDRPELSIVIDGAIREGRDPVSMSNSILNDSFFTPDN